VDSKKGPYLAKEEAGSSKPARVAVEVEREPELEYGKDFGQILEALPDQARIVAAIGVARQARGKINASAPVPSADELRTKVRQELIAAQSNEQLNPSRAPLSDGELTFASDVLLRWEERQVQLTQEIRTVKEAAVDDAVAHGQFARMPNSERQTEKLNSPKDRLDAIRAGREEVEAIHATLARQLGVVGKDWWYSRVGAGTCSYLVYVTRTQSPRYFMACEERSALPGEKNKWITRFFQTRDRTLPPWVGR